MPIGPAGTLLARGGKERTPGAEFVWRNARDLIVNAYNNRDVIDRLTSAIDTFLQKGGSLDEVQKIMERYSEAQRQKALSGERVSEADIRKKYESIAWELEQKAQQTPPARASFAEVLMGSPPKPQEFASFVKELGIEPTPDIHQKAARAYNKVYSLQGLFSPPSDEEKQLATAYKLYQETQKAKAQGVELSKEELHRIWEESMGRPEKILEITRQHIDEAIKRKQEEERRRQLEEMRRKQQEIARRYQEAREAVAREVARIGEPVKRVLREYVWKPGPEEAPVERVITNIGRRVARGVKKYVWAPGPEQAVFERWVTGVGRRVSEVGRRVASFFRRLF